MSGKGKRGRRPGGGDGGQVSGATAAMATLSVGAEGGAAEATMTAPKPASAGKRSASQIVIKANMWLLSSQRNIPLFRYDIALTANIENVARGRDLTTGAPHDAMFIRKRQVCFDAFSMLRNQRADLFDREFAFAYDRSRILISTKRLDIAAEGLTEEIVMTPQLREAYSVTDAKLRSYTLTIKFAEEMSSIVLGDYSDAATPLLAQRDRSIQQALELFTSQQLWRSDDIVSFHNNHYSLSSQPTRLTDVSYLSNGFSKNVRIIEGARLDKRNAAAALQADLTTTPFFDFVSAMAFVEATLRRRNVTQMDNRELKRLQFQLKDVVAEATHTQRLFAINRLSDRRTADITLVQRMALSRAGGVFSFNVNGVEEGLPAYYYKNYQIRLRFTDLPCLVESTPRGPSFYPIELCNIADNQIVAVEKLSPDGQAKIITNSAVAPERRFGMTTEQLHYAGVMQNSFLTEADIRVAPLNAPITLKARVLPLPSIVYQGAPPVRLNPSGVHCADWPWPNQRQRLLMPAACDAWTAVAFNLHSKISLDELKQFVDVFAKRTAGLGMTLPQPFNVQICQGTVAGYFSMAAKQAKRPKFVLCVTDDGDASHGQIKLQERVTQMQTQNVTLSSVKKVMFAHGPPDRNQCLNNVLAKTNMKLGGLNYAIELDSAAMTKAWLGDGKRLFVGLDVNHPGPLTKQQISRSELPRAPSVVGICANTNKHPLAFTGNYYYQGTRREETASVLRSAILHILARWKANHDALPQSFILYRDGVSEGQHRTVLEREVPEVRAAMAQAGCTAKLTVVVVAKRHNTRLLLHTPPAAPPGGQRLKNVELNVPSGTIADHTIVHPSQYQFYLNSQRAIQGTSKPALYDVLLDENKLSVDELQGVTFALTFDHQVANSPTSLPAPIEGAHSLAKRGKDIYRAYTDADSSTSGVSSASASTFQDGLTPDDFRELNEKLGMRGTVFENRWFYA